MYLDHGFPESFEDKFEDLVLFNKEIMDENNLKLTKTCRLNRLNSSS